MQSSTSSELIARWKRLLFAGITLLPMLAAVVMGIWSLLPPITDPQGAGWLLVFAIAAVSMFLPLLIPGVCWLVGTPRVARLWGMIVGGLYLISILFVGMTGLIPALCALLPVLFSVGTLPPPAEQKH